MGNSIRIIRFVKVAFLAAILFCGFGVYMSMKQHRGWAQERQECRDRGGVPWQAKHSGGPICLDPKAIKRPD